MFYFGNPNAKEFTMGCASSSPLINGGGPGGVVEAAQQAASDVVHAGENALHGMYTNNSTKITLHIYNFKYKQGFDL